MTDKGTVLIVEDEEAYCNYYREMLARPKYNIRKYHIEIARDLNTANDKPRTLNTDIVLLDLRFPPSYDAEEGLDFLKQIQAFDSTIKVIVVTNAGDFNLAVRSIEFGAYDFVKKNTDSHLELLFRVNQAYERLQLENELKCSKREQIHEMSGYLYGPGQIIVGTSEQMATLYRQIDQVAPTDATVLIRGENGTGKELIAKAIHYHSQRRQQPIITVNCGTIPAELFESELFGHVKGAFTGATSDKKGLFEEASGGTLFLDEIGAFPLALQVKLLRVIQEQEIRRVGDNLPISLNLRIISATNVDLEQAIQGGTFREDLYFRLNVFSLRIPSLRERTSDIPILAKHFLHTKSNLYGKSTSGFDEQAIHLLINHTWPGNVRELEYMIERAVLFDNKRWISAEDIEHQMKIGSQETSISFGIHESTLRSQMKRLGISEKSPT